MKMARYTMLVLILSVIVTATAVAEEIEQNANPFKGKALWQMVDTLYGDVTKCWKVPEVAASAEKEVTLLLPLPSPLQVAYQQDKIKMEQLPAGQRSMVNSAYITAYFLFGLLITIALSSLFLWLGAGLAGERSKQEGKSSFMKALICSSFDRAIIAVLLVAITFGLGRTLNAEGLSGVMGHTVIPVFLLVALFLVSTWIVKMVYRIKWGKAFLIQICARVAVVIVAVFILGLASAVSLASAP